jgi:transposase
MGAKRFNAVVFKPYHQNQTVLFPSSLDEMIAENHPVRVVSRVIDTIDIKSIHRKYKGGGTSAYHPRLLLKILVYGYLTNTYSSRKLEEQVRQNIHFMWLTGMMTPDHHTINRFRGEKLAGILKEIFSQIVLMLIDEKLVTLKEAVFVDGTKMESAANRYTFVWGKAVKKQKDRIKDQLDELWKFAQQVAAEEMKDQTEVTFEPVTREKVEQVVGQIDQALAGKDVPKAMRQKLNNAKKKWPERLDKYDEQEKVLAGRNSYAKTDPDATFMRMKDDHLGKGQLKPAYNLQISTQDQFILNYSLHQNAGDMTTMKPHLAQFVEMYNTLPAEVVADAGYGSSENYAYLEESNIEGYVKYNNFDNEQKKSKKAPSVFTAEQFGFDQESRAATCPAGLSMTLVKTEKVKTTTGFERTVLNFQGTGCADCPLREQCLTTGSSRTVDIDPDLRRRRQKASALLRSEKGIRHRKKRGVDVESTFGNIKQNHNFRRFRLRTIMKAEVEIGLLALAQNFRKWTA